MKKIIAAATGLMMVGGVMAASASAFESEFGGYWRTRMYTQIDFDGQDSGTASLADTRTRLYYTAIFNENFKFVNKFEFNSTFGDNAGGDIGADGMGIFRIKNSYADFKLGNAQFKVGTQGATLARGFAFADDFSGVVAIFDAGAAKLPFGWIKISEGDIGSGKIAGVEGDIYAAFPIIEVSDAVTVNPYLFYGKLEGLADIYWAGADVDFKMDGGSFWGTGIYQFGDEADVDISAFLVAAGGSFGPVHGQAFYSSGQDDGTDITEFTGAPGASYYWAEILGFGTFDGGDSGLASTDKISGFWAANVGFKVKPAAKLTVGADLWYVALSEDNENGDSDVGIEIDVKASYQIMDNLKIDVIGAYLLAGDAFGDEDAIEVGTQLSLSF